MTTSTQFIRIGTDGNRLVIWSVGATAEACDADLAEQEEPGETSMLEVPAEFDATDIGVEGREGLVVENRNGNIRITCTATGDSCTVEVGT